MRILILLCFPCFMFAQQVEFIEPRAVQEFEEVNFKTVNAGDHNYVIQEMQNIRKPINMDLQVVAYNSAFKFAGSALIDQTPLQPGDANLYFGMHVIGSKLYMFKAHYDRDESALQLFYYPIDHKGDRGSGTLLASIPADRALNSGHFGLAVSPDGKKLAVLSQLPNERGESEKCIIHLFDESFNPLLSKPYTFPYESSRNRQNRLYVNNHGNVFIKKHITVRRESNYHTITSFKPDGNVLQEIRISFDENPRIVSSKAVFTSEGDLVLTGFYYNDKRVSINIAYPSGIYFVKIQALDGSGSVQLGHPFRAREHLTVTNVFLQPDNTLIISGERQSERKTTRTPASTPPVQDTEYTSSDIYLWSLNPDGDLNWHQMIERKVSSKNDQGRTNDVFVSVWEDNIQLIFRDYLHKHDGVRRTVVGPDMANVFAAIWIKVHSETGEITDKGYITDERIGGKRGEYMFIPATGVRISQDEYWMLAARRSTGKSELVSVRLKF